jgi:hypothetical protein
MLAAILISVFVATAGGLIIYGIIKVAKEDKHIY